MDAAVIHLPNPEITHHVTKINFMTNWLVGKKIIYSWNNIFQYQNKLCVQNF